MVFKERTKCPTNTDYWYIRHEEIKNGKSYCIKGKPQLYKGSVLSNCVGYAWGRQSELEGKASDIGCPKGSNHPVSAYAWMKYTNGRKTGKTAKLGAVAVWKSNKKANYGHVAVVERVNSDGSWLSSESHYNGVAFQNKKYDKNSIMKNFTFLGFIYCKVDFENEKSSSLKVGDKVKIMAKGNSRKDGQGKASGGVGWTRYILSIYNGYKCPYKVGSKLGITTGYYKESALKKV